MTDKHEKDARKETDLAREDKDLTKELTDSESKISDIDKEANSDMEKEVKEQNPKVPSTDRDGSDPDNSRSFADDTGTASFDDEDSMDSMTEQGDLADHTGRQSKATMIWMGVSFVLAVLLVIVSIANPFGKKGALSDTLATVNGVEITKEKLFDIMYENGGENLLENLIVDELLDQAAAEKNVKVTEQDIDAEIERHAVANEMTVEELRDMFTFYYGMSEETFRQEMGQQVKIRRILSDQIHITDEQIQQFYEENIDEFFTPEQVRASHILVETEDEALEILDKLNDGEDFAKLASERSLDTSATRGGDLDYFSRGVMAEEFEEVAFSLEVGQISKNPVKSIHGYHIIMKTDHQPERTLPLEEVRDKIVYLLEDEILSQILQIWFASLRESAKIEYFDGRSNEN